VCIRQIKCNLNVFIGVFDKDDAVAVPFEKNGAAFLDFGWPKVRLLEKETTFSNASDFTFDAASFCLIGAARRVLAARKAMRVSQDFI